MFLNLPAARFCSQIIRASWDLLGNTFYEKQLFGQQRVPCEPPPPLNLRFPSFNHIEIVLHWFYIIYIWPETICLLGGGITKRSNLLLIFLFTKIKFPSIKSAFSLFVFCKWVSKGLFLPNVYSLSRRFIYLQCAIYSHIYT